MNRAYDYLDKMVKRLRASNEAPIATARAPRDAALRALVERMGAHHRGRRDHAIERLNSLPHGSDLHAYWQGVRDEHELTLAAFDQLAAHLAERE